MINVVIIQFIDNKQDDNTGVLMIDNFDIFENTIRATK